MFAAPHGDVPYHLHSAMDYTLRAPGKRIRPFLAARCAELAGGNREDAWPAAVAIESVHAFSLIHDDLPCMDDDDLRRGRPTNHTVYGEDIAILAGDALFALAFELLARHAKPHQPIARMVLCLAEASGWAGMIGGQTADVRGQSQPASRELVEYIHDRKTAALIAAACELGALSANADDAVLEGLRRFGHRLGRAFQIVDDLLDVTGTAEELGKKTGKDGAKGKQTYPRCVGIEASRDAAAAAIDEALSELRPFGSAADDLRMLASYIVARNY